MKRIIAVLLLVFMLCTLTACGSIDELRKSQAEEYANSAGFEIVKELNRWADYYIFLVYDRNTHVEYILTWGGGTAGFCPYYDENGDVAFYKGGE